MWLPQQQLKIPNPMFGPSWCISQVPAQTLCSLNSAVFCFPPHCPDFWEHNVQLLGNPAVGNPSLTPQTLFQNLLEDSLWILCRFFLLPTESLKPVASGAWAWYDRRGEVLGHLGYPRPLLFWEAKLFTRSHSPNTTFGNCNRQHSHIPEIQITFSSQETQRAEEGKQAVYPSSSRSSRSLLLEPSTHRQARLWCSRADTIPVCEVMDSSLCFPHYSCLSWQWERDPCWQIHGQQDAHSRIPSRGQLQTREATESALTSASPWLRGRGVPSLRAFLGDKVQKDLTNVAKSFWSYNSPWK